MSVILDILEYNRAFVKNKKYTQYKTTKYPDKKIVILTCMDTRLLELLPKAMNLKNGDAKIIKNAGAVISHPFGSIMRSLIVAIYELNAQEVCVIGHHDCGMASLNADEIIKKMKEKGIADERIDMLNRAGIDISQWLTGFKSVEESVRNSVQIIRQHPLFPSDILVHGLIMEPETGKLELISD